MSEHASKPRREPWVYIYWGTAAMMLTAIGIFAWSILSSGREGSHVTASESPRTGGGRAGDAYQVLSRFNPPAYRDLGGAPQTAQFRAAMANYARRDYSGAISGLRAADDSVPAHFYLGLCYLYTDDLPAGIAELQKVLASGTTPYSDQAHFYLAKGLLRKGDVAGARQQLDAAIALHGDVAPEAETLLARLK